MRAFEEFMLTGVVLVIGMCLTMAVHAQVLPPTGGGGTYLTCIDGSPYDRFYQFGDDRVENGIVGTPAGVMFGSELLTLDSIGTPGAGDFNDLEVFGQPVYADTSGQPLGENDNVGIRFDGLGDYLVGSNMNAPQEARSSIDYLDEDFNPAPGPCNYRGIELRTMQFWVRPDASGLGNGLVQSLVVDSNQHGVLISANDTWVLRFNEFDVDSKMVADSSWHHVMVSHPFGTTGLTGGARLFVDGVAIAAAPGDYDSSRVDLVVGANTSRDTNGEFNGGTAEFFVGEMDRLLMQVHGDNSADGGPPSGQDYGRFNFGMDNDFATDFLSGVAGDVNNDGVFDMADRSDFINGWLNENVVDDLHVGDIHSIRQGDLDFNGFTDVFDLVLFQDALIVAGMAPITVDELVSEPTSVGLLSLGLGWLLACTHLRGRV